MTEAPTAYRVRTTTGRARVAEMHFVKQILSFSAQLKSESFRELEVSGQAGVDLPQARPTKPGLRTMHVAEDTQTATSRPRTR